MLKSHIIENFLSDNECDYIRELITKNGVLYEDIINGVLNSYYYTWDFYKLNFADIKKIFDEKLKNLFGNNLIIDHSHILYSMKPYGIHTDYFQRKIISKKIEPAYTFIIPLYTLPTNTLVFNQHSKIKDVEKWIETEKISPVIKSEQISNDVYEKYLSHVNKNLLSYFTIKEIFPWKKGSLHACDRQYFHSSDNYKINGLENKTAIIMWTSMKKGE
jgi:hypothetical protein